MKGLSTALMIFMVAGTQAQASEIALAAKAFQENNQNLHNLMKLVGSARSLAISGCPAAVDLVIRSYNAYIFQEKSGTISFIKLVNQAEKCQ